MTKDWEVRFIDFKIFPGSGQANERGHYYVINIKATIADPRNDKRDIDIFFNFNRGFVEHFLDLVAKENIIKNNEGLF